jgi:hypothetical protein
MKVTEAQTPPATTVPAGKVKLEVYGGPHHGRLLMIPKVTKELISIAASLPKGDTFRETRTNPKAYAHLGRVIYQRRVSKIDGNEYLGFVDMGDVQVVAVTFENTEIQYTRTSYTY